MTVNFRAFTFAPGRFIFLALRVLCLRLLAFSTVKIQFFLRAANGDCLFTGLRLIPGLQKLLCFCFVGISSGVCLDVAGMLFHGLAAADFFWGVGMLFHGLWVAAVDVDAVAVLCC